MASVDVRISILGSHRPRRPEMKEKNETETAKVRESGRTLRVFHTPRPASRRRDLRKKSYLVHNSDLVTCPGLLHLHSPCLALPPTRHPLWPRPGAIVAYICLLCCAITYCSRRLPPCEYQDLRAIEPVHPTSIRDRDLEDNAYMMRSSGGPQSFFSRASITPQPRPTSLPDTARDQV